jgi:Domain of unknown function (DUF3597)
VLHGWASLNHHLAVNQGSCDLSEAERDTWRVPALRPRVAPSRPPSNESTMGFFSTILETLGLGSTAAAATPASPPTAAPASPSPMAAAPRPPQPVALVDVVAQLEQRAAANPQKLNWRTSIVDLLKLLDIDSSLAARKELATELGCPAELMADSAKMNIWLHKTVLARIAANGGNVPQDLLN